MRFGRPDHTDRFVLFSSLLRELYLVLSGSILACFLGPDGGPREGAIRLVPEKIDIRAPIPEEESIPSTPVFEPEDRPTNITGSLGKKVSQRISGYFGRIPESVPQPAVPLTSGPALERTRTFSTTRTSRINGSAYGYGGGRNRIASNATRRGSLASSLRRRGNAHRESQASESSDLNFAQRLLMANENAVTNIADLWVAAAMNVDNEDPFESDTEIESDVEPESDTGELNEITSSPTRGRRFSRNVPHRLSLRPSTQQLGSPRPPSSSRPIPIRQTSFNQPLEGTPTSLRRFSTREPSIFSHPGVKTPTAVLDAQMLISRNEPESAGADPLAPIAESRPDLHTDVEALVEKPPSLSSQIPILVIVQYGLLALHTTTHDQVFMSYLVSWVTSAVCEV